MAKIIKIQTLDEKGGALSNVVITISGIMNDLRTNADGLTQFLSGDGSFDVCADGHVVFSGTAEAAPDVIRVKKSGNGFVQA